MVESTTKTFVVVDAEELIRKGINFGEPESNEVFTYPTHAARWEMQEYTAT